MTLQASGAISIGNIVTEKGGSPVGGGNYSLASLSTTNINAASTFKPNGNVPHAISEFYSYDHGAVVPTTTEEPTTTTTSDITTTGDPTTTVLTTTEPTTTTTADPTLPTSAP